MNRIKLALLFLLITFGSCRLPMYYNCDKYQVNVWDFGAVPNDGKDDSDAIQKAIDFAISNDKVNHVYIPPGRYDLEKGVVIINDNESDNPNFITLTISGHQSAYSPDSKIGKTTVFNLKKPSFGVAIQYARNCIIENIVFVGCAKYTDDVAKIVNWTDQEWGKNANASTNRFSPSCAIVIDPFHVNVPPQDRYLGFERLYKYKVNSGTSMLLIKGCAFYNHYIAIANNPSNGAQNGDNIRAENCCVTTCHTFWSAGQTQSRGNSIENLYALHLNTLISGGQIGSRQGTPPTLSNVNLAGFCKTVFDISTGYASLNVYRSYFESIWSLGCANGTHTSFDQCQFSFRKPDEKLGSPLFQLFSDRIVSFRDCDIQYFDNCDTPLPFVFKAAEVIISGGLIEGGVVVADGINNAGDEDLNKVRMDGVIIKCQNKKVAGKSTPKKKDGEMNGEILFGGEVIYNKEGDLYLNCGNTYNVEYLGQFDLKTNMNTNKVEFFNNSLISLSVGDNLFSETSVPLSGSIYLKDRRIAPAIGFIQKIEGEKIIVAGVPNGFNLKQSKLYKVSYPILNLNSIKTADMDVKQSANKIVKFKEVE